MRHLKWTKTTLVLVILLFNHVNHMEEVSLVGDLDTTSRWLIVVSTENGFQVGWSLRHLHAWKMKGNCVYLYKKTTFFKRASPFR